MTDKEVIIKAFKQARKHGCSWEVIDIDVDYWLNHKFYYAVIFDHEFVRCFFSEKYEWNIHSWQYHLQQMVLCEEPLNYLRKFLDE